MHPYPHTYRVSAAGEASGTVAIRSEGLPELATASPPEFDGPGGVWSPETLLVGSIANCFILTFRALARATRLEWRQLECRVQGILEKADGVTQFTRFETSAELTVASGTDEKRATELLERAERGCLIANSLRGTRQLTVRVRGV